MKTLTAIADQNEIEPLRNGRIPSLRMASTDSHELVDLAAYIGKFAILFFYPATGVPSRDPAFDPAPGWDDVPGAAGCTAESCSFQDLITAFKALGSSVFGVSTQPLEEQREFKERKRLSYPLISDPKFELAESLGLPTFMIGDKVFYKRLTIFVKDGVVKKIFGDIADTAKHADEVLAWLRNYNTQ